LHIVDGHIPKEMTMPEAQRSNAVGGGGGEEFADDALPPGSKVVEVRVRGKQRIDAVQIVYETPDGARHSFPPHGGQGGDLYPPFTLDRDEYITGISGKAGARVDSLRIHTNRQISTLFGGGGGRDYNIEVPPGHEFVGFHGRAKAEVDRIGVLYRSR
jgi:Jacalin-like lectin domain